MQSNINNYGDINLLNMRTQPILPLVYSDALSYMEELAKLTTKINEVVTKVNCLQSDILEQSIKYTDSAIEKALVSVSDAINEINNIKIELNNQYNDFEKLTNAQLLLFHNRLNTINKRIDDTIVSINERTDLAIKQNNEYLLSNLSKYLSQIKVINFFTGARVSIQDMFDYLALLHTENALVYNSLVAKNLTYDTLNGLNVDYTTLVLNGSTII